MRIEFGLDGRSLKQGAKTQVIWDSLEVVNGHCLLVGMSGAGKTHLLKEMARQMTKTSDRPIRIHVMDVHGDIEMPGASSVMFSEQTHFGLNPLRINADPHFGGIRKRVQSFITILNRAMRCLGPKQEAVLRNVLYDVYQSYGFKVDDPSTWIVDESEAHFLSDGSDGRFYIDVPLGEKDQAKVLGARWAPEMRSWYIRADAYSGAITRWPPKTLSRSHPSIVDVVRVARNLVQMLFLGTGAEATIYLEAANRAAASYQRKILTELRRGNRGYDDEKAVGDLEKAKAKAVESYAKYAEAIISGSELENLMKYDSTDVLKSVLDRLENLQAIGIFKSAPPPFEPRIPVWHYNLRALSLEERKLFVLFRLEEIFEAAVQRGEQADVQEVIILDEAHIYADDAPDNIINNIAKEARKFGLALVCASQSPTHFTDDFVASVATKVILGIDEMFWRSSVTKMRVTEDALAWIKPRKSMLVQMKSTSDTRSEWQYVVSPDYRMRPTELNNSASPARNSNVVKLGAGARE